MPASTLPALNGMGGRVPRIQPRFHVRYTGQEAGVDMREMDDLRPARTTTSSPVKSRLI
jgi:hypothetical protein